MHRHPVSLSPRDLPSVRGIRLLVPVLLGAALALVPCSGALAAKHPEVKILVHLVPVEPGQRINCFAHGVKGADGVRVDGEAGAPSGAPREYLAYVLLAGFDREIGLTAVQFGIAYDAKEQSGVDVVSWNDCALVEFHLEDWPQAGTGNLLTWNQKEDCQNTEPLTVGFFRLRVYSSDRFRIIPRPVDGILSVAACGLGQLDSKEFIDRVKPENTGWAGFGTERGYNPWDSAQHGKMKASSPGAAKP